MAHANTSENCSSSFSFPLSTREVVEVAKNDRLFVALLAGIVSATFITIGIFIENSAHILRKNRSSVRRQQIMIMGLYPVFVFTSALSLILPSVSSFALLLANAYLATALYTYSLLVTGRYGQHGKLLECIMGRVIDIWPKYVFWFCQNRQRSISPITGPQFMTANRATLRAAAAFLVITAVVEFLTLIFISEFTEKMWIEVLFIVTESLKYIPAILAIQMLKTFYILADDIFKLSNLQPTISTVLLFLFVSGLQDPTMILTYHVTQMKCQTPFTSFSNGLWLRNVIVTFEIFIFNYVVTTWMRWLGVQKGGRGKTIETYSDCFYKTI